MPFYWRLRLGQVRLPKLRHDREIGRQGRTRTDIRLRAPASETGVDTRFHHLPSILAERYVGSPAVSRTRDFRSNNPLSYRLDDRGSIYGTSRNRTDRTVLAKHRRLALVHAVPWNPRAESNRRSTGFVIRCLSAWLRGHDTASLPGRGPSRHLAFARVAPRRRLRIARLAVNARLWVIVVCTWPGVRRSNPRLAIFRRALEPSQLTPDGGVGVSRTRSSHLRLIDVAGRRLTVRPPLPMRSRRALSRRVTQRCPDRRSA